MQVAEAKIAAYAKVPVKVIEMRKGMPTAKLVEQLKAVEESMAIPQVS